MTPTLPCTVCSARGYLGERHCPNCHGFGFIALMGGRALGWRRPLDHFSIGARNASRAVNKIIDIALIIVIALAAGELLFGLIMGAPLTAEYWANTMNGSLLFFWFGCFCAFMLIARRRAAKYESIP